MLYAEELLAKVIGFRYWYIGANTENRTPNTKLNSMLVEPGTLKKIPNQPGVYIFKDTSGRYLYIGKAAQLRKRVQSYFTDGVLPPKVNLLKNKTASLDYILTSSEVEALVLESNLIKEHQPRYNVSLRDDKKYPYIKIALAEEFPSIYLTRDLSDRKGRPARQVSSGGYFGPYTNAKAARKTLRTLRKIFPFRNCKKKKMDGRPCLDYHIGKCLGPCTGKLKKEDYREVVREVTMFLEGKQENLLSYIKEKIEEASKKQQK